MMQGATMSTQGVVICGFSNQVHGNMKKTVMSLMSIFSIVSHCGIAQWEQLIDAFIEKKNHIVTFSTNLKLPCQHLQVKC